jgi:hypothetical protein
VRRDRDAVVGELRGRDAAAHHGVDRDHDQEAGARQHDRPGEAQGAQDMLAQRQVGAARRGGQGHHRQSPLGVSPHDAVQQPIRQGDLLQGRARIRPWTQAGGFIVDIFRAVVGAAEMHPGR